MATKIDNLKWKLFQAKRKILFFKGIRKGLIETYDEDTIRNLQNVYYGGVPASIILFSKGICNHYCYDRGLLVTLGFGDDDFRLVDADIDSIRLNPENIDKFAKYNPHYSNHCFAERVRSDGSVWVYDTTLGLVIEKNLYYQMEHPVITKINDKEATVNFCDYQDIKNADIEKDKYGLPLILPNIETIESGYEHIYSERLKQEIEDFKQKINYDSICKEMDANMRVLGYRK